MDSMILIYNVSLTMDTGHANYDHEHLFKYFCM